MAVWWSAFHLILRDSLLQKKQTALPKGPCHEVQLRSQPSGSPSRLLVATFGDCERLRQSRVPLIHRELPAGEEMYPLLRV